MTDQPTAPIQTLLRLPAPLRGALDDLAAREGRPLNALAQEALEQLLRSRGVGTGVEAGLDATHAAYRAHRDRIREALRELALTEGEASLICDAMNGVGPLIDTGSPGYGASGATMTLYAEVADGCSLNSLHEKWGVDQKALLRKLRGMTPLQAIAVLEATERFWADCTVDTGAALRVVGLVQG